MQRSAGVYFVGTGGLIPPQSTTHMEAACTLRNIYIFYQLIKQLILCSKSIWGTIDQFE